MRKHLKIISISNSDRTAKPNHLFVKGKTVNQQCVNLPARLPHLSVHQQSHLKGEKLPVDSEHYLLKRGLTVD